MAEKRSWKARMGHLLRVPNEDRRFGSWKEYYCTKLQMPDGEEFYALLTEADVKRIRERAEANKEDLVKTLRIVDWFD